MSLDLLGRLARALALNRLGATVSHASIALMFAILWTRPLAFGEGVPDDLILLLVFEFLVFHSTAFLVGFRFVKGFPLWIFAAIYSPFALLLAGMMSSPLVGILFAWHLVSGVWGDVDMSEKAMGGFLVRYFGALGLFMGALFFTTLIDPPALGWEGGRWALVAENGSRGSDAFVVAWGTYYFTARAGWEVLVRHWERTGALGGFIARMRGT